MFVSNFIQTNGFVNNAGPQVTQLMQTRFDPGLRQPYLDENNNLAVMVNTGRWTVEKGVKMLVREPVLVRDMVNNGHMPAGFVTNATSLRKEEWLELDRQVLRAARYRLGAWADLSASNTFGGFNGMSKSILEHETMTDPGEAIVDMTGLTPGRTDSPLFQLQGMPLPITHSDFFFDLRRLTESRNTGTPLDTTMGEAGGRRIAETIEKTTIGNQTGITYGGNSTQVGGYGRTSQVYGYTNFSARLTKTNLYSPTGNGRSGTGWVAADTLKDVLSCLDIIKSQKFYGGDKGFMVYTSNDWDQYMDNDYILTGGNVTTQTLRNRLKSIQGIQDVKRLDFMFASATNLAGNALVSAGPGNENLNAYLPFTMLFVQMTPDVAQAVNGMDITTLQWETVGGMQLNFKIMCIQAPRLRADAYGNCGILQATFNHA